MKILVCMKQILDPDVPARDFRIDAANKQAERGGANLVPNIFCENALETALQLRDATDGEVTALTFGTEEAEDVVRKALAMTVNEAAHVIRPEGPAPDALTVARVLVESARVREESRGSHLRTDYPEPSSDFDGQRIVFQRSPAGNLEMARRSSVPPRG